LLLLLFFCVTLFAISPIVPGRRPEHVNRVMFTHWMRTYNKTYLTPNEYSQRFQNFVASLERVKVLNSKSPKAQYGVTKFSDMSPAEFKSTILMKNPIVPSVKPGVGVLTVKVPKAALPVAFDWRTKGAVTPVKNQEQCGSCWAFSVTENVESMWILAGKSTNSTIKLAPQQIVDCDTTDAGCDGGDPPSAYEYIIQTGGMEPSKDYPYTAVDGTCNFQKKDVAANIKSWKYATEDYSETTLQQNLVGWGPLSICVDASNWQDYQNGVMSWEECAWVNLLDHCVQLVGYQTKTSNGDYWIVRNSWGTEWGINGYIWLEMGSDTCGLAHEATCAVV